MSKVKMALIFLVASILQLSLINIFSIFGIVPNLILCLVCIVVFLYDDGYKYIWIAAIAALLCDMPSMNILGLSSLSMLLIGIYLWFIRQKVSLESVISPIFVGVTATVLNDGFIYIIGRMMGSEYGVLFFVIHLLLHIVTNILVIFVLYLLLVRRAVSKNRAGKIYEDVYYKV